MNADTTPRNDPPQKRPFVASLRAIIDQATEPSASVPEIDRPQAQLLSYLLLIMILLLAAIFLSFMINATVESPQTLIGLGALMLLLAGVYILSRSKYQVLSVYISVLLTAVGVWFFALSNPSSPNLIALVLTFSVVSMVLSSQLLSLGFTLGLGLLHLAGVAILPRFYPNLGSTPQWDTLVIYVGVTFVLTSLVAGRRQRNQDEIRRHSQALAEREAQLESILDNSNTLISLNDVHGRYLMANRQYESLLHQDSASILGKTAADLFGKETAESFRISEETVLESGESLTLEETALIDEEVHTYISVKFPLKNAKGIVYAVGTLSTDITDRKQMEEALLQSNERFQLVSYATNDAVWDRDLLKNTIRWNQNLRRIFGYAAESVGTDVKWWEGQIHPEDREKVLRSVREAIARGDEFWSKEYRFRRADGSFAHVFDRGYVTRDRLGRPVRMLGALMDITRWRTVEKDLETERNLLRMVIELIPDLIYVKDAETRVLLDNMADAHALGAASPQDVIGKTDFDLFPHDLAARYYADDQLVIQSGQKVINQEEPFVDKSGNQMWLSTTKVPLLDADGKIIGLVGIGHDITDIKNTRQALQEANRKQTEYIRALESRTKQIGLLNEMSDLLQSCPSFEEVYRVIAELTRRLFPDEAGGLYIISASRNILERVISWGDLPPDAPVFTPNDCWSLRLGRVHVMDKTYAGLIRQGGNTLALTCNHVLPPGPDAYVCVPLVAQGEAIGLLHLSRTGEKAPDLPPGPASQWFDDDKEELARAVAYRVSLALANLKLRDTLRQQSIRDALTGLFNRRYLEESLEREIHRVIRSKHPLGIIMVDIDHFKRFNDTYGHEAGDAVLREISIQLKSKVRFEDIACRYGGDEFVLILPDASLEVTRKRADALCEEVRNLSVKSGDHSLGAVTISAGVATFPDHGPTGEEVVRAADAALFRAKKAGRDRVMLAEGTSPLKNGDAADPRRPAKKPRKVK